MCNFLCHLTHDSNNKNNKTPRNKCNKELFLKEKSKQNITRDIEIKNNLTIATEEERGKGFQELV